MGERRGTKALETWCRRVTQGYPGVKVENMTTSWRDGLAFCALIHHFRPDLIDFSRLDKADVYGNNELAFRIAERHLGIPALLDAEDMAEYPVPDRLSILTYLSQFYQAFASNSSSPVKKASSDSPDGSLVSLVQGNVQPPPKMEWSAKAREPCAVCNLPVFIAQRLRVEGRLYHRTCFRCARCSAQLNPADCYETCTGEFVCETCPDEMAAQESPEPSSAVPVVSPGPPSPAATPPPTSTPPEPPPSLVAMRRLMFDTDDAKLLKHDHSVNTTRVAHSIKKDLSTNVDSRSLTDKEEANSVNIDIDKSEDLSMNPEADSSPKNRQKLDQCVNNSTIPPSSSIQESAKDINAKEASSHSFEEMDNSVNLVDNPSAKKILDLRQDTLSFNDNRNNLRVDEVASHSDSDKNLQSNEAKPTVSENADITEKEAINTSNTEVKPLSNIQETEMKPSVNEKHEISKQENVNGQKLVEYPSELNPFGESDDEEAEGKDETSKVSTNPFGSDSDEEEQQPLPPPRATPRKMSISLRSTASTNPFDSDEEDDVESSPVPLPRQSRQSSPDPTPFPRRSKLRTSARSITSLSSIGSYSSTSPRKKRPAPPPPPTQSSSLSPSSRYSSVSSLNRPRKNKRAPLPPSMTQASVSKPADKSPDTSVFSEGHSSIPHIEVVSPPEANENSARATGELVAEIEKGLQKLIAQDSNTNESESMSGAPSPGSETLPPEVPAQHESLTSVEDKVSDSVSRDEPSENIQLSPVLSVEMESSPTTETKESDPILPVSTKEEKDTRNRSSKDATHPSVESEIPSESAIIEVDVHTDNEALLGLKYNLVKPISFEKESNSLEANECFEKKSPVGDESCDKSINIEDSENKNNEKTGETVETYNEILLSNPRNSSVIEFEEIKQPAHSTPIKIIPSLALLDSSTEDLNSGNSLIGISNLSSPAASCADTSSYQESLSSPPTEKRYKDSANMHRKFSESGVYNLHKSTYGQWKRKKAPAPPLPIPQKRQTKPMAIQRIRQELNDIEIKQQELERQGVALEQKIRLKFDSDTSITPYLEDLVLQLFELVNEKNELFRKQAELMYIRRQHQLEDEHAELEFQIRCLMARPEANKTDSDKELEEKLIQRLVEVVERRDAIVQCLEMDRLREVEEDKSINNQLDRFTRAIVTDDRMKIKKKHKKKKDKHNTLKMLDLDKDFDETENESRKKKKWYTLHHKMTKHL